MKCALCHKEYSDKKYRPFCSKRCADIDLANWFNEKYTFEAAEIDEQDLEQLSEALEKQEAEKDCD